MQPKFVPIALFFGLGLLIFAIGGCPQTADPNPNHNTPGHIAKTVHFPGAGTSGAGDPLEPGIGPQTAVLCSGSTSGVNAGQIDVEDVDVIEQEVECFYAEGDPIPGAGIERLLEIVNETERVHVRLTFDPRFVDNTYGATSIGWGESKKGTHAFKDLVGSDHAEFLFWDKAGKETMRFKLDYITEDADTGATHPSGYGSAGVDGGDGKWILGDQSAILGWATSLDRNLNGCGFAEYIVDSPATDAQYTPNPATPEWDYRVVYELWVDAAAFGPSGFGAVTIEWVHASPSKTGENTLIVTQGDCPDDDGGGEGEGEGEGEGGTDDCNPKYEDCGDVWADPPV
ncbi:MAG: hypothetical protein MUC50_03130 [Myxococcota bacterium]|nr:hypothetical protein [Myxococcota bacterium]